MNNITLSYSDTLSVDFTSEAWFNATAVAKHFGKLPNEWLRLDSTKEYIEKLEEILMRENPAFKTDGNELQNAERVKAIEGEVIPKHETVPTDKISISLNQGLKMMLHQQDYIDNSGQLN